MAVSERAWRVLELLGGGRAVRTAWSEVWPRWSGMSRMRVSEGFLGLSEIGVVMNSGAGVHPDQQTGSLNEHEKEQ